MLVISDSLVLSDADAALPDGTPLILWDNRVTISNISASTADAFYPVTNLANPATNQEWRAVAGDTTCSIEVTLLTDDDIDGVGIARHNFGSEGVAVSIEALDLTPDPYEMIMLHFDGTNGSTTITDSNDGGAAHTWTAAGNAHIAAGLGFGSAAALFDGTGDYVTTPDHADFTVGAGDWTVDFRFYCTAGSGTLECLFGQGDAAFTNASISIQGFRYLDDKIYARACVGGSVINLPSTSTFTNGVNAGWHHCAFVRSGGTLMLFIDGVRENDVVIAGTINDASSVWAVGTCGAVTADPWTGYIDEFRFSVGVARWTADFSPPSTPHHYNLLAGPQIPPNDEPILFQFTPQKVTIVRVVLTYDSSVSPRAAVLYVGPLLITERGYDVGTEFTPPLFARKTQSVNGMSHAGDFLGRIITSQAIDGSVASWKHFTPDWYRDEFDPFVAAAQRDTPFFFAWLPEEYPYEVAFAWLAEDPYPVVSPITRRMHVSIKMDGIVE